MKTLIKQFVTDEPVLSGLKNIGCQSNWWPRRKIHRNLQAFPEQLFNRLSQRKV